MRPHILQLAEPLSLSLSLSLSAPLSFVQILSLLEISHQRYSMTRSRIAFYLTPNGNVREPEGEQSTFGIVRIERSLLSLAPSQFHHISCITHRRALLQNGILLVIILIVPGIIDVVRRSSAFVALKVVQASKLLCVSRR